MSRDYVQEKAREKADEHVRMCMKAGLRPSWESLFMAGYQEAADYENHIRLSRYDRIIQAIRDYKSEWGTPSPDLRYRVQCRERLFALLAEEPKP